MKFHRFLAALPLLTATLWAASPAVNDLVLPEKIYPQLDGILKRAVQQSPQMLNRMLDLEIAENNRVIARSNLLPGVSGAYSYYESSDDRADLNGRVNVAKIYYNFSATQPIFYWGERRNSARMGEIQQKIAQGSYRDGYRLLAQEIRGQFLQLIVRKTYLDRTRLTLKYRQDSLKAAEDRFAKKEISDADIFSGAHGSRTRPDRDGAQQLRLRRRQHAFALAHRFKRDRVKAPCPTRSRRSPTRPALSTRSWPDFWPRRILRPRQRSTCAASSRSKTSTTRTPRPGCAPVQHCPRHVAGRTNLFPQRGAEIPRQPQGLPASR